MFHFFVITSQIIIVFYDLNKSYRYKCFFKLLNLINLNEYTCKTFNYFYTVSRSFSTFLTLYFSFERGFATFFPIKMMQLKPYFSQIYFGISFMLLFVILLISVPELFTYDLVEFYFGNSLNRTIVSLCDISYERIQLHETFRFYYVIITVIIPFFLITCVNIFIGIELKRRNSQVLRDSMIFSNRKSSSTPKFLKRNNSGETNNPTHKETEALNAAPIATISELNLSQIENEKNSINLTEKYSINEYMLKKQVLKEMLSKDKYLNKIRNRNSNTKLLVNITTFYAFFNLPYLFNLLYIYLNRSKFSKHIDSSMIDLFKYRYHIVVLFSEILYVANYSLNGLLLFAFGKIYRIHLKSLVRKIACWHN